MLEMYHAQKPRGIADQAQMKNWDTVCTMACKGADVNEKGWRGYTALHFAAKEGAKHVVEVLLGARADVDAREELGQHTPLVLAGAPIDPFP